MFELRRVLECGNVPVQVSEPAKHGRLAAADVADVAIEVLHIDSIKSDDGYIKTYVCFGDVGAKVVWSSGCYGIELGFGFVKVGEEVGHRGFVGFLGAGEASFAGR
jgi:hypothetical protein